MKQRKIGRSLGVRGQVLIGFGIFALVIVALLWVFQITLLNPFYRSIKIAEVKSVAQQLGSNLESDTLDELAGNLTATTATSILISDELGNQYVGYKLYPQQTSRLENLSRSDLRSIFEQVNLQGGTQMETYTSPFATRNGYSETILYACTVHTARGNHRLILLESELTPVNSTVETLKVQLVCLTFVMLALGIVLAFVIAGKISRPISSINESAKELGRGNYQIRFEESGAKEVSELGHTLNYAAGELSKVDGLRRELLANVSHDLRTPLTMIKGYSEVMRDLPGENTPENVQIIIDEATRLTDLVNDLLDLSKLEAGAAPLECAPFNLTAEIRTILTRYDKLADYRFPFAFVQDVEVVADRLKISQVVYNLVNNAITYAGEDKTIRLSQTVSGGRVRISVTDTGEGIPAEKLRDIWERYYKVDKEHKRAQVGTGLGLSIVRNVLELHGGTYGVESQLGRGSTFWFELTLEE